MAKKPTLVAYFVLCASSTLFSFALAQNASSTGSATIGALPGGPGGRDVPIAPPDRPDPLLPFYNPDLQAAPASAGYGVPFGT